MNDYENEIHYDNKIRKIVGIVIKTGFKFLICDFHNGEFLKLSISYYYQSCDKFQ